MRHKVLKRGFNKICVLFGGPCKKWHAVLGTCTGNSCLRGIGHGANLEPKTPAKHR